MSGLLMSSFGCPPALDSRCNRQHQAWRCLHWQYQIAALWLEKVTAILQGLCMSAVLLVSLVQSHMSGYVVTLDSALICCVHLSVDVVGSGSQTYSS